MKKITLILFTLIIINSLLKAQSGNLEKVSLQLQWKHQFEFAGFYIAKEKGFYNDVGLDVVIKEFNHDTKVVNDVVSGNTTFGTSYPGIILDKSNGKNLVLLSAILQSSPHALISLKSSNIKSLKDFKNKSIMINKDASVAAPFVSMLLSKQISLDDLNVQSRTFGIDDLIHKKVDISTVFRSNEPYLLRKKGILYDIWDPKDYGFDFYDVLLFTSSTQVDKNPIMVQNFKNASIKGWEYAFSNIDETINLILDKYNSQHKSKDALLYEANELRKLAYYETDKIGEINKSDIQRIFDVYNLLGLTKDNINLNEFIFNFESILFTKNERDYLKNNKFKVYVNNWKPFSSYDSVNKTFKGLSLDFWKKISKTASINHSLHYSSSFSNLLLDSKENTRSLVLSLSYTVDREKYGVFTKPYVSYPIAIATNIKEDYIIDLANLSGKKVAVGKNFSAHKLLKKYYPNIKYVEVKNTTEALSLLANEKVYAAADILPTLSNYLGEYAYANLKISGTSEFKFDVRMMVNKEHSQLIPILNKAIDKIKEEEKKIINNKWLYNKQTIEKVNYFILGMVLTPIILILFFLLVLYYNQKHYIKVLKKKENYIQEQSFEVKNLNTNLEKIVKKRTSDLLEKTSKIEDLLNNVAQGFLSFDKDFLIDDEYSVECEHLLGDNLTGKDITKLLFAGKTDKISFFKETMIDALKEKNKLTSSLLLSLLPKELIINKRAILIEYKIITNNKFMLILTNITDKKKLQTKLKKEQLILKMIVSIVSDSLQFYETKENFELFCKDSLLYINTHATVAENINTIITLIHTFKGLFAQLYMHNTVKRLHTFESEILMLNTKSSNNIDLRNFVELFGLENCMNDDLNIITNTLGEKFLIENTQIKIEEEVIQRFEDKIFKLCSLDVEKKYECDEILLEIKRIKNRSLKDQLSMYPKLCHQLCLSLNKSIYSFEIIGDDSFYISERYKPLINSFIHVFRNCCDHGIETKDVRLALDKKEKGTIVCSFEKKNNMLNIEIGDDGEGIDIEILKSKLLDNKLITQNEIESLSDEEIISYIFSSNYSSSEYVTDISGRGIGLSSVKNELDKLDGSIEIKTEKNIGTSFIFRLPLLL